MRLESGRPTPLRTRCRFETPGFQVHRIPRVGNGERLRGFRPRSPSGWRQGSTRKRACVPAETGRGLASSLSSCGNSR